MMNIDLQIDIRGQDCPLHVLRLRYGLNRIRAGQVLKVITSVPDALTDFKKYCTRTGDELVGANFDSNQFEFVIRKKA